MTPQTQCPTPEVLSAFVAGTLPADERRQVSEHLRTCDDCLFIVKEAERTDRQLPVAELPIAATAAASGTSKSWLALAAAVVIVVGVAFFWTRSTTHDGVSQLIDAAPRDGRYLEPRLSGGFPWAPLRSITRDAHPAPDPGQMRLVGAAGKVLQENAGDSSPRAQRAAALAQLLSGHSREAVRLLSGIGPGKDVSTWSDLAAAQYTLAVETGDTTRLHDALAAADAALALNPTLPEALFNRALILERLGPHTQAAQQAWQHYLSADSSSPWATEARRHLAAAASRQSH